MWLTHESMVPRSGDPVAIFVPSGAAAVPSRARRGFTWTQLLVVFAIIGTLVVLLIPAQRSAREPARITQCRNNLKMIGLALHNYNDVYGSFPPPFTVDAAGRKLHSWRTLILPFLDQAPLYERIDLSKPWNDPVNEAARRTVVPVYHCPSLSGDADRTTYMAVVGSDGVFRWGETISRDQIRDATAQTLLVLEANGGRSVPWMEPADLDEQTVRTLAQAPDLSHTHGIHTLRADGSVRTADIRELSEQIRALVSIAGGDDKQ
jgi:type II secretory pathway pseudopilin PulG